MRSVPSLLLFGILFSLFVRYQVSRWPHSGQATPPMYGDYEAQRHWMEITVGLPVGQWYIESPLNNLTYWGLDYPPLTAYHMYLNGRVAKLIDPSWVKLNASAGTEGYDHKLFMRSTVLVSDIIVFYPALLLLFYSQKQKLGPNPVAILTILYMPSLIVIDHGHFQYNCVSLGLCLLAIYFLQSNHLMASTLAFCLALNYKQISLFYAIPFFVFMLSKISSTPGLTSKLTLFTLLAITVLTTFGLCWLPFLKDLNSLQAVVRRIFPVDRGLFEDKVANVWCPLETILKLRTMYPKEFLLKMSTAITLVAIVPTSVHLYLNRNLKNFKCSLAISALSFFLFGFQVHEKGILFASLAGALLVESDPLLSGWLSVASSLSLMPLMIKDGLVIPMLAVTLLFTCLFLSFYSDRLMKTLNHDTISAKITVTALNLSIFGHVILLTTLFLLKPPKRYPDLFTLLYSTWSCLHFIMFYLLFHVLQFQDHVDCAALYVSELLSKPALSLLTPTVAKSIGVHNGNGKSSRKKRK